MCNWGWESFEGWGWTLPVFVPTLPVYLSQCTLQGWHFMRTVNLLICQIISDVLAISFTLVYFFVCSLILSIFMGKCYSTLCLVILLKCIVIFTAHVFLERWRQQNARVRWKKRSERRKHRPPARPPARYKHTHTNRQDHLHTAPLASAQCKNDAPHNRAGKTIGRVKTSVMWSETSVLWQDCSLRPVTRSWSWSCMSGLALPSDEKHSEWVLTS